MGNRSALRARAGGKESEMVTGLGDYFTNVEALKMVTSRNASLFRLSGERDPYRAARLGEISVGAWADVLLMNGDPTADLTLLADPDKNIAVIVKDGTVLRTTSPGDVVHRAGVGCTCHPADLCGYGRRVAGPPGRQRVPTEQMGHGGRHRGQRE